MNHAVSITPPPSTLYSIHCTGSCPREKTSVRTATVPRYASGMRGAMTPRTSRYAAPMRMATAEVSPMQPPIVPSSICPSDASGSAGMTMSCSGVDEETISTGPVSGSSVPGAAKRTSEDGNSSISSARPASAGLKMFWPSPPNRHLTTRTAKTLPSAACQYGTEAGSVRASSRPVTAAEPSVTVWRRRSTAHQSASAATAAAVVTSATIRARRPNTMTPAASGASSAMSTSRIVFEMLAPE